MWILIGECIIFIIISYILRKVRNYKFYYEVLECSKYPLYNNISVKEKAAYFFTKLVNDIPSFSFAPSEYDFWKMDREREKNCSKKEKRWINISFCFLYIRAIIGHVLYDLIILVTVLFQKGYITLSMLRENLVGLFNRSLVSKNAELLIYVINWIQNNVNVIVVIIIILISVYIGMLNRTKRKYSIEAIWAEEEADRIHEVAKIQKELEDALLEFRNDVNYNMNAIQIRIRSLDGTESKDTENIEVINDSDDTIEKIKELLHKIVEIEGIQIFIQRNKLIYTQLAILDILPTISKQNTRIILDLFSKESISGIWEDRKDLCTRYAYGVAFINGINRFLKFTYKKRKQYNKIILHLSDADYLKGLAEKLK